MDWLDFVKLIFEAFGPILLGLLSRNTQLTKQSLINLDSLQQEWRAEMAQHVQFQAEIKKAVKSNDDDIKRLIDAHKN